MTHLPQLRLLLQRVHEIRQDRSHVGIVALSVSPLVKLEEMFGWDTFDDVIRAVAQALLDIKQECLREADFLAELSMSGNSFVLVLSPPRKKPVIAYEELGRLRDRISTSLQRKLDEPRVASQFGCFIGCAVVQLCARVPLRSPNGGILGSRFPTHSIAEQVAPGGTVKLTDLARGMSRHYMKVAEFKVEVALRELRGQMVER